jgi:hypothetical protein
VRGITRAITRLRDLCDEHGEDPAAPGATPEQIADIRRTFCELGFALPAALLEVYRVTLAIPGVFRDGSILHAPCVFDDMQVGDVRFLINEKEDADKEGVLWLGRGSGDLDLIIDRKGLGALRPEFRDDGTVALINPRNFESAFLDYARAEQARIRKAFESG